MIRKLADVLGAVVFQAHPLSRIRTLKAYGFKRFAVMAPWYEVQTAPDKWEWDWLDEAVNEIINEAPAGEICFNVYGIPCWKDPTFMRVENISGCAIGISRPEWIQDLQFYTRSLCQRYGKIVKEYSIQCETNIRGWWRNPKTLKEGDPREFVKLITEPMARIIHEFGGTVISPGITLQGENQSYFDRAIQHFTIHRALTRKPSDRLVDNLDIHVYRDKPQEMIDDIFRFKDTIEVETQAPLPPAEMYITEWGFNESMRHLTPIERFWNWISQKNYSGQDAQFDKLKPALEFLAFDDRSKFIYRTFYYSGFDPEDGSNTKGLIDKDGNPKQSLELIALYL